MKTKNAFLTLFICVLFIGAKGQDYTPLLENNKTWDVLNVLQIPNGTFYDTTYSTTKYKLMGDTTINSYSYFKLYKSNEEHPENWILNAYLREEQKKVWFLNKDVNEDEELLYNFGASQGDTIDIGIGEPVSLSVDSITEVEIDGVVREKYWLSNDDYRETWIAGIGSNKGLLYSGSLNIIGGWYWLLCVSDMEELIYSNPSYESCYLMPNDDIPEISSTPLHIYPNPATSKVTFELPIMIKKSCLKITDIFGKTITEIPLKKGQKQLDWDCNNLVSGIYFYQMEMNGLN